MRRHLDATWLKTLACLFILLPGFPLWTGVVSVVLESIGMEELSVLVYLIAVNVYLWLPALLFGEDLFPFGTLQGSTNAGDLVAALFYGVLALALSFPIAGGIKRLRHKQECGEQGEDANAENPNG